MRHDGAQRSRNACLAPSQVIIKTPRRASRASPCGSSVRGLPKGRIRRRPISTRARRASITTRAMVGTPSTSGRSRRRAWFRGASPRASPAPTTVNARRSIVINRRRHIPAGHARRARPPESRARKRAVVSAARGARPACARPTSIGAGRAAPGSGFANSTTAALPATAPRDCRRTRLAIRRRTSANPIRRPSCAAARLRAASRGSCTRSASRAAFSWMAPSRFARTGSNAARP